GTPMHRKGMKRKGPEDRVLVPERFSAGGHTGSDPYRLRDPAVVSQRRLEGDVASRDERLGQGEWMRRIVPECVSEKVEAAPEARQFTGLEGPVDEVMAALRGPTDDSTDLVVREYPVFQAFINDLPGECLHGGGSSFSGNFRFMEV